MRAGGSAADAAVAASAVLAVTTQHSCGMGGDLFALVHDGSGPPAVLNSSGRAGSGADPDRLRAEGHTEMPFVNDVRSVPVPGCGDGWLALHERYGRLGLGEVLAPAIAYPADGFPPSSTMKSAIDSIAHLPEAADYTAGGPLIARPGVVGAFHAVVADGRDGHYGGEFGAGLLELGNGEYEAADLDTPLADWVAPIGVNAWGHDIWTVPPNSQGYLGPAGAWIAAGLDLPENVEDGQWAHLLIEAARYAGFDRPEVLHEHADGEALLSETRLGPRRAAIDPQRAALLPDGYREGGTIYLCAVDGDRMGVSLIQSNAAGFGSLLIVPGVRIFLQNRGIGFSLEPGTSRRVRAWPQATAHSCPCACDETRWLVAGRARHHGRRHAAADGASDAGATLQPRPRPGVSDRRGQVAPVQRPNRFRHMEYRPGNDCGGRRACAAVGVGLDRARPRC